MEAVLGVRADWRATGSAKGVQLRLEPGADREGALAAIRSLVGDHRVTVAPGAPVLDGPKRRRVWWAA